MKTISNTYKKRLRSAATMLLMGASLMVSMTSCDGDVFNVGSDPAEGSTYKVSTGSPIADVLAADERFSDYVEIIKKANMYGALNQSTTGVSFTALAPTNEAIQAFCDSMKIKKDDFTEDYSHDFVMYHTVKDSILPDAFIQKSSITNLSNDKITLIIDTLNAGEVILKNNNSEGHVTELGLEASNGKIYVLSRALTPLTEMLYDRLVQDGRYGIMLSAIDETGWKKALNTTADTTYVDGKENIVSHQYTVLAVTDDAFRAQGISDVASLKSKLQQESKEALSSDSLLRAYVAYHILGSKLTYSNIGAEQGTATEEGGSQFTRLWSTSAKSKIFNITTDTQYSEDDAQRYVINSASDSPARFVISGCNVLALNGYVQELDSWMPVWEPAQQTVIWDFVDDNAIRDAVEKANVTYQPTEAPSKQEVVSLKSISGIEYTETESKNTSFAAVSYYTQKAVTAAAVSMCGAKNASNYDCIVFNVGNAGTVKMTTPTLVRGKYKVTLDVVYNTSQSFMNKKTDSSGGTLEMTFDDENKIFVAPYTLVQSTGTSKSLLAGTYTVTLYDEIEFDETEAHTFFFKVKDGAASTNKNWSLQFDTMTFTPIE